MFTHMVSIKKETHQAHGANYELLVYQVQETGEYRIYVAKGGFGIGDIFTASQEVVRDSKVMAGTDVVTNLLATAKDDIDRNEFGHY